MSIDMPLYIGTKLLRAAPMTRGEYNEYRGWKIPTDEDPNDRGFLVEYTDGGKPNVDNHNGYISWSPEDVFNKTYRLATGLTFSFAFEALKKGVKIKRKGWNGKDMFLFFVAGSTFKVNRPPLLGIYPEGTEINYHAHIDIKTADNMIVPWVASQTDILAEDWQLVDGDQLCKL